MPHKSHASIAQEMARRTGGISKESARRLVEATIAQQIEDQEKASDSYWADLRAPGRVQVTEEAVDDLRDRDELAMLHEDRLEDHFATPAALAEAFGLDKIHGLENFKLREEGSDG